MARYGLFLIFAVSAVMSPGPGVALTLSNALRFGFGGAFSGILGIATGTLVVAGLVATGLGLLLAASPSVFIALKYGGAAYLFYLGVRLWRAPAPKIASSPTKGVSAARLFATGLTLQLINPKAIVFFLSVYPQFVDPRQPQGAQFLSYALSYCAIIVIVHSAYAILVSRSKHWLLHGCGAKMLNRIAALAMLGFGGALALGGR